jgi:hypothetical protein
VAWELRTVITLANTGFYSVKEIKSKFMHTISYPIYSKFQYGNQDTSRWVTSIKILINDRSVSIGVGGALFNRQEVK